MHIDFGMFCHCSGSQCNTATGGEQQSGLATYRWPWRLQAPVNIAALPTGNVAQNAASLLETDVTQSLKVMDSCWFWGIVVVIICLLIGLMIMVFFANKPYADMFAQTYVKPVDTHTFDHGHASRHASGHAPRTEHMHSYIPVDMNQEEDPNEEVVTDETDESNGYDDTAPAQPTPVPSVDPRLLHEMGVIPNRNHEGTVIQLTNSKISSFRDFLADGHDTIHNNPLINNKYRVHDYS